MRNKIEDLRDHLFETLEALKDPDKPMDIGRAKAVCDVAGKIIDSAKVEVEFASLVGSTELGSGFIALPAPTAGKQGEVGRGITAITGRRVRG